MSTEGHGHGHFRKPYKVWTADRTVRKGLTATNLDDLIRLAKQKLEVDEEVSIVLEDDGTEIDSELYFQTLQANTVFLVLRKNERWHPAGVDAIRAGARDETDQVTQPQPEVTSELLQRAMVDNDSLLFMSVHELECLSKLDSALYPDKSAGSVKRVMERASQLYNQRKEVKETLDLIKVINRAMNHQQLHRPGSSGAMDEPDRSTTHPQRETSLLHKVLMDSNSLLFMSIDELQSLSDMDPGACTGVEPVLAEEIVEQAGRIYNKRMEAKANLQLAKVIERALDQGGASMDLGTSAGDQN